MAAEDDRAVELVISPYETIEGASPLPESAPDWQRRWLA